MVLEAATDEGDAVGEKGGGDGVAAEGTDGASVEGELEGRVAVDAAAMAEAEGLAHERVAVGAGAENFVGDGVALDDEPAAAAGGVAPLFAVVAATVVAHEEVVGPLLVGERFAGSVGRGMSASPPKVNSSSSRGPHQGQGMRSMAD